MPTYPEKLSPKLDHTKRLPKTQITPLINVPKTSMPKVRRQSGRGK